MNFFDLEDKYDTYGSKLGLNPFYFSRLNRNKAIRKICSKQYKLTRCYNWSIEETKTLMCPIYRNPFLGLRK